VPIASSVITAARAFRMLSPVIMANSIILVITGIIAILALLVDEICVTLKDGDSFINDFLKSDAYKTFTKNLQSVIDTFKEV